MFKVKSRRLLQLLIWKDFFFFTVLLHWRLLYLFLLTVPSLFIMCDIPLSSCLLPLPVHRAYSPLPIPHVYFISPSPPLPLRRANCISSFKTLSASPPVSDVTPVSLSLRWSCGVSREALTYRKSSPS